MIDQSGHIGARVFGLDGKLFPDTGGALGLSDIRTLDALFPQRYVVYIRNFVQPEFGAMFAGTEPTPPSIANNPMFDLLGVRWVLASSSHPAEAVAGTTAGQYRALGSAGSVAVYENEHALPRAFVVHRVHAVPDDKQALASMATGAARLPNGTVHVMSFDPAREAVIESATLPAGLPQAADGPRAARIVSYGPEKVMVEVDAGASGLLVLTDQYFPGWEATVNGKPSAIAATDFAFRGVTLGPEQSRVVFRYHPAAFSWGLMAMACGLGAVVVMTTIASTRRKRLREAASAVPPSTVDDPAGANAQGPQPAKPASDQGHDPGQGIGKDPHLLSFPKGP